MSPSLVPTEMSGLAGEGGIQEADTEARRRQTCRSDPQERMRVRPQAGLFALLTQVPSRMHELQSGPCSFFRITNAKHRNKKGKLYSQPELIHANNCSSVIQRSF